jgi:ABC-type oligopeptide transport system substrate-binding subunit
MEMKAPGDGIVVYQQNYSLGSNAREFQVGDQVWAGAALGEIPNLNTLEMEGKLDEIDRGVVEVGDDVRTERAPSWSALLERATRGDYAMAVLGWQADTPDPNDFLSVLLGSEFVGTTNRTRYRSAAMDDLLKQGRRGDDQRERAVSYLQAQALFRRDMPWIPLFHVSVFTVHRRDVQDLVIGPTGIPRYDRAWKTP